MINLRISKNRDEVIDTICKMFVEQTPAVIWQNKGDRREVQNAIISHIDFEKNRIILTPHENSKFKEFNSDFVFYLKSSLKSILFKAERVRIKDTNIVLSIPEEVRLFEQRAFPRIDFEQSSNIKVDITKSFRGELPSLLQFNIVNISQNGACLSIISNTSKYFYEKDLITINSISGTELNNSLSAKIIFLRSKKIIKSQKIRVHMGVQFEKDLDLEVIKDIEAYFEKTKDHHLESTNS